MESGTHLAKSIRVVAAALSTLLMLFSFMLVGNNSQAANNVNFNATMTSTATITATSTTTTPPTTTTDGNGGGTPPTNQPGSGFGLSFASFITGTLIFLGIVSALLVGLLVLRRRLLPSPTPKVNLPPSGAQPWKRVHPDSLHGD